MFTSPTRSADGMDRQDSTRFYCLTGGSRSNFSFRGRRSVGPTQRRATPGRSASLGAGIGTLAPIARCSSVNRCPSSCPGPRLGPERTSHWIKPEGQGPEESLVIAVPSGSRSADSMRFRIEAASSGNAPTRWTRN